MYMYTVGNQFPDFELKGVVSNDLREAFKDYTNESDSGKWKVFVFYPKDFTFVCPTELTGFNDILDEFTAKNAVVYGVSTDSEFVHHAWRVANKDIGSLRYPLLSDIKKDLSEELGVLDMDEGVCMRATFIVDPEGKIRHLSVNDLNVGRNPREVLRVLEALQQGGLMPCNWQPGQPALEVA